MAKSRTADKKGQQAKGKQTKGREKKGQAPQAQVPNAQAPTSQASRGQEKKAPAPAARPTTKLKVEIAGKSLSFRCFDNNLGKVVNREILAGEIYRWPPGVPAPKTVVDVGANVGAAALFFATSFPEAKVYAFEPTAECVALARENLDGCEHVTLEDYGLFDQDEERRLFVGRHDSVTNSLGQSAFNAEEGPMVKLRHAAEALRALGIEEIDCLKLDTEGSEVPILEALAPFLPAVKVFFVEYHSETDRRRIDLFMAPHHILVGARVQAPHRGELTYARRDSYPEAKQRDRLEIRPPLRNGRTPN